MNNLSICQLRKIGDLFAVPLFFLLIFYLYNKGKDKGKLTFTEKLLLFFAIVGLIADLVFSMEYLFYNRKC